VTLDQLPEADIAYDPAQHRWTVTLLGEVRTLSEWRWAPRKRLVAAAADGGRIDPARFADGFAALCWTPAPPSLHAPLWAWIGLSLAGLGPLLPAADAEAALAARLGLTPAALEGERASDLEPLLGAVPQAFVPEPGWSVLRFEDDVA
jgi:hypothetical protein